VQEQPQDDVRRGRATRLRVRHAARQQVVEDRSQGVHVRARVEPVDLAARLLGWHVRRRADDSAFVPGETTYFQYWFRDPAAGGAAFNTSDALRVTFKF